MGPSTGPPGGGAWLWLGRAVCCVLMFLFSCCMLCLQFYLPPHHRPCNTQNSCRRGNADVWSVTHDGWLGLNTSSQLLCGYVRAALVHQCWVALQHFQDCDHEVRSEYSELFYGIGPDDPTLVCVDEQRIDFMGSSGCVAEHQTKVPTMCVVGYMRLTCACRPAEAALMHVK